MNHQLDSVIEILLSADNQRRSEAEQFLTEITNSNFNETVDGFLHVMNNSNPNVNIYRLSSPAWPLSFSKRNTSTSGKTSPDCPDRN